MGNLSLAEFDRWGMDGGGVGEVKLWLMPSLKNQLVPNLAFIIELRGWDSMEFFREVEAETVKIIGKYSTKTELTRSWAS